MVYSPNQCCKRILFKKIKHKNIAVIGNPIPDLYNPYIEKKNIFLNVGRFIASKNQLLLIDIFDEINPGNWKLWFVGEMELYLKIVK